MCPGVSLVCPRCALGVPGVPLGLSPEARIVSSTPPQLLLRQRPRLRGARAHLPCASSATGFFQAPRVLQAQLGEGAGRHRCAPGAPTPAPVPPAQGLPPRCTRPALPLPCFRASRPLLFLLGALSSATAARTPVVRRAGARVAAPQAGVGGRPGERTEGGPVLCWLLSLRFLSILSNLVMSVSPGADGACHPRQETA